MCWSTKWCPGGFLHCSMTFFSCASMDAQHHKRRLMFGGSISHRGKSKRIGLELWWCFGQWCAGRRNNSAILSHKRFRSKRDHLTETDLTNMFTRVPSFSFDCVGTLATPYFLLTALVTCAFEAMRRFCNTCSVAKFLEALIFAHHGFFVGVLFFRNIVHLAHWLHCWSGVVAQHDIRGM